MAKSVCALLAVLAVAVSLDAVHRVSAAGGGLQAVTESFLSRVENWIKDDPKMLEKLREKLAALNDIEVFIDQYGDKDPQGRFTAMAVNSEGGVGVILINTIPFLFLNKEELGLLKNEFPESELNAKFHQLCTTAPAPAPKPVTLLFKDTKEVDCPWYKKSDGSMCLGILLWTSA